MAHSYQTFSFVALVALVVVFPLVASAQAITDGLVACYPFAGNADDIMPGGAHGTIYGATLIADAQGVSDHAYDFNGGSHIQTTLTVQTSAGTVSAWTYVYTYQTGYNQLNLVLGQWDNLQLGLGDSSLGADGQWIFRFRDGGGTMRNAIGPLTELGRWIHVAGVWDGSQIILYLDGQPAATVPAVGAAAASGSLMIGRHTYAQNYWFGIIDDVMVYDRALTPAEIEVLAGTYTAVESRSWGGIKAGFRE